jgi:hypothetical protein
MLDEWIIGEWYLSVKCKECQSEFAFQRKTDPFDPKWAISKDEFVLVCPDCRKASPYEVKDILTVQARG